MEKKLNPLERKVRNKRKISAVEIVTLCKENKSLSQIAELLGVNTVTVATHIGRLLRKRKLTDISFLVPVQTRQEIEEAFLSLQTASVKQISLYLRDRATPEQILIVRGHLQAAMGSED